MSIPTLLQKLIDIEKSIGREPDNVVRKKIHDAQDYALQMQKEVAEKLRKEHPHGHRAA